MSLVLSALLLSAPCTQAAPADTGKPAACTGVIVPTKWAIDAKECCRFVKVYDDALKLRRRWSWVRPAAAGFVTGVVVTLAGTLVVVSK
tara:strand:- start:1902 stop:2168 length:267 start_codon:yes stop_codon:yes gene_type:complete